MITRIAIIFAATIVSAVAGEPNLWTSSKTSTMITVASPDFCAIATIADKTEAVSIDWDCLEREDLKYVHGSRDQWAALAHVIKAVRLGDATITGKYETGK